MFAPRSLAQAQTGAIMAGHTPTTPIRVPRSMWAAYGRVCTRLGRDRTEDLLAHIRRQIRRHGDETDLADLKAGDEELRERRSRKGGRPRQS
jgi:hypothetical protein